MTNTQWMLIAALVALHVMTCLRTAATMRRIGRRPLPWFLVSLFLTSIPAAAYMAWRRLKALRPPAGAAPKGAEGSDSAGSGEDAARIRRCPHCGEIIPVRQDRLRGRIEARPPGMQACPKCGLDINKDHLA